MTKTRGIIIFIMAMLSSILTFLDYLVPDPLIGVDEIGLTGLTGVLWLGFSKVVKASRDRKNTTQITHK